MEAFAPELADAIDPGSVEFADKELLTQLGAGTRHIVDLLAKVRLRGQPAGIAVLVEAMSWHEPGFPRRLFRYFSLASIALDRPVYPIAVFSYPKPTKREPDRYEVDVLGLPVLRFRFLRVHLARLSWRKFLKRPNAAAAALMARMRIAPRDRPRVKVECLRMIVSLKLDRARMLMLSAFVDTYLRLDARETKLFAKELANVNAEEKESIVELTTSWKEEGRAEGRAEGRVDGVRRTVQRLLTHRLGPLPDALSGRLGALDEDALDALTDAILDLASVDDLARWLDRRG